MKTILHPEVGEVELRSSLRARRVTLTVRASGVVRLTYPWLFPQRRALAFLEEKVAWILHTQERLKARQSNRPERNPDEQRAYEAELRRAAKADLPARIERLSQQTGLVYTRLTLRAMRTKWGSCTGKNAISLTIFLMELPEELRDFVILHELCHTRHHNHSPQFHALLNSLVDGHEKSLQKQLRTYSIPR